MSVVPSKESQWHNHVSTVRYLYIMLEASFGKAIAFPPVFLQKGPVAIGEMVEPVGPHAAYLSVKESKMVHLLLGAFQQFGCWEVGV